MQGFLWPEELRTRWWLRAPAALAAMLILLLTGFVVGSLWATLGVWPTHHILVPFANNVFNVPYFGHIFQAVLIFVAFCTRFGMFILLALLVMPFFWNAKMSSYIWSLVAFMFYGWFFATMYIIYH